MEKEKEGDLFDLRESASSADSLDRGFKGNNQRKSNTVQTFNALNKSKWRWKMPQPVETLGLSPALFSKKCR